jgi:uncharacterized protein YegL
MDYTWLALIADRSGSMISLRDEAEGAIKSFVNEQRNLPGQLTVNLFEFDDRFDEVAEDQIDVWTLTPRGATALYDAIGKSMVTVGERLAALPEDGRPDKVVIMIVTDGLENASKEWALDKVKELVRQQIEKYQWQVIFTAANLDAAKVGASLGSVNNMNFAASPTGVQNAYGELSKSVSAYRSGAATRTAVPDNA